MTVSLFTGLRVKKTVNGIEASYYYNGKYVTHLSKGGTQMHFFYDAQGRPSIVQYNDVDYAYLHNLQGDVTGIVDMTGMLVVQYAYDAWGRPLRTTGSMAGTLGYDNPFRYRGYVYEEETGLYYLRSRYYNPEWGRFISADTLLGKTGALLSHNAFAYCINNPIKFVDSDGTEPILVNRRIWGTHTEIMPASHLVAGMIEIGEHGSKWKYGAGASFQRSDCNGAFRFIAKQYYTESTYNAYNIRTVNGQILRDNCYDAKPISCEADLSALIPGEVIFSQSRNHVWVYVGEYNGIKHAVADVANYTYRYASQSGADINNFSEIIKWPAYKWQAFTAAKLNYVSYKPKRGARRIPASKYTVVH